VSLAVAPTPGASDLARARRTGAAAVEERGVMLGVVVNVLICRGIFPSSGDASFAHEAS